MRLSAIPQIITALAVVVSTSPISTSNYVVVERRSMAVPKWSKHVPLHPDSVFELRIGLVQQNLHLAEEFIAQVSDPSSEKYGQHWPAQQVAEMFMSSQQTVDYVKSWLAAEGVAMNRIKMSRSGNWLTFNATAVEAERLLQTKYHVYRHEFGHEHIACDEYSIPSHLLEYIDIITPTIHFDRRIAAPRSVQHHALSARQLLARDGSTNSSSGRIGSPSDASNPKKGSSVVNALVSIDNCDRMITPACLRALYKVPVGTTATKNNTLGIVEYTPQAFLQSDLDLWFDQFSAKQVGQAPITDLIDGAIVQTTNRSFDFNGESSLDLQYAMSLVYPQQVTLFQVGDVVEGASFNNFLDALDRSYCTFEGGDVSGVDGTYPDTSNGGFNGAEDCGSSTSTHVISTSYSTNEADLSAKYEQRQCLEYMKLGLQGVSILYSSGDYGVAGNGGECIDTATNSYNDGSSGTFNPSFPGTCPYITSVGATQIVNGSTVRDPESASETVIFSGGGFSNVFAMPSYQKSALSEYFTSHLPTYSSAQYNNSQLTRGYPDVSANGVNYVVAVNGEFTLAYGTSASTPTFASLINLINEKRLRAGKSTVGFLNPVLYANSQVMNDITTGGNKGCGTTGFESVEGWDPVTGLGTPDYQKLESLFLSLP
ncbi:hypothetical protein B7494_g2997 [Chlorociboria aeruginascens]|nr:hypothetical protein B7494_g2997 [Chlorociboria aeruginascens]